MAIYRADQAQLTFGAEAAIGGYPEGGVGGNQITGTAAIDSSTGASAGDRSLSIDSISGFSTAQTFVGKVIRIGTVATNYEVRRVVFVDGTGTGDSTLHLDAPLAFYHQDNTAIVCIDSVDSTSTTGDTEKFIDIIPGVYETVDLPDPQMSIEPHYFLGTASKRDFYSVYSGQQSFTGSLGNFVLLDGKALRFPIGKVTTIPLQVDGSTHAIESTSIAIDQNGNAGTATAPPAKGDIHITVTASHGITDNDYIVIYGAASASSSAALAKAEVRKVLDVVNTNTLKLDYPLTFDHAHGNWVREISSQLSYYSHSISETVDLDTVTWHAHMRASDEDATKDFDRRYFGGKIGSASIAAEEGGMVSMSWNSVNFIGMVHNQARNSAFGSTDLPFYTLMKTIDTDDVNFSTAEPYYFSHGEVSMFGQTIARIRSFTINISNGEEPRYYIKRQHGRHRGPTEIREGRREYSMSATLALPDAGVAATSTTRTLFSELLLEGDYGSGKAGFDVSVTFTRGTNDSITITIPDNGENLDGSNVVAGTGGNKQGAFIRTAPHNIAGDNVLEVEADILFRNLKIDVSDSQHYYP